ncbi:hypothetical protein [Streptomyces sp. NPDC006333]|uniref:hypothetical protein n=1 Tax=Streptomyces sp. NPDC006333 TaxID=3156753 RepID=UPI0033BAF33C
MPERPVGFPQFPRRRLMGNGLLDPAVYGYGGRSGRLGDMHGERDPVPGDYKVGPRISGTREVTAEGY